MEGLLSVKAAKYFRRFMLTPETYVKPEAQFRKLHYRDGGFSHAGEGVRELRYADDYLRVVLSRPGNSQSAGRPDRCGVVLLGAPSLGSWKIDVLGAPQGFVDERVVSPEGSGTVRVERGVPGQ